MFIIYIDLDSKMKNKLKGLIQQEIDKLLIKITEENNTMIKSRNNNEQV